MSTTNRTKYGAEFSDIDGDAIRISTENDPDAFSIRAGNTYREFPNDQAPTIALTILAAAGHIKPAGVVTEDARMGHRRQLIDGKAYASNDDPEFWTASVDMAGERFTYAAQQLLNSTAIRDHLTNGAQEAKQELTRRRDEIAQKLVGDAAYAYRFAGETLQTAIDMIIQAQDAQPEPPKAVIESRAALTADDLMDVPEGTLFISSAGIPLAIARSGLWRTVADLKQPAPVVSYLPGTLHINTTHEATK